MDPDPAPFTLRDWEMILRDLMEANEERRREYIRWTAAGFAAIGALTGLLLQTAPLVGSGLDAILTLAILAVLGYLITEAIFVIGREKVVQALGVVVGAGRFGSAWDLVTTPEDAAQVPVLSGVWVFSVSFGVTAFIALSAVAIKSAASGILLSLAELRVVLLGITGFLFWGYRSLGRKRAAEEPTGAADKRWNPAPPSRISRIVGFLFGKGAIVIYYGIQLWLAAVALLAVAAPTLPTIEVLMLTVAILGIGRWVLRITWPLVGHYAGLMGAFQRLHDGILTGVFADADSVSTEVRRILPKTKPPDRV